MSAYDSIRKIDWFIERMSADWYSYDEIVGRAANEFPDISREKLEGTIGQYWSDCVNEKWSTYKAIRARGLRVLERNRRRRIVDKGAYRLDDD